MEACATTAWMASDFSGPAHRRIIPGPRFLHKGRFTRGMGKFHITPYAPAPELPDATYPFLLTTGRVLYHYHTMISRKSKEPL